MSYGSQNPFPTFLHIGFMFLSILTRSSLLLINQFDLWTAIPRVLISGSYSTQHWHRCRTWILPRVSSPYPHPKPNTRKNKTPHASLSFGRQPTWTKEDCRGRGEKYHNNATTSVEHSASPTPSVPRFFGPLVPCYTSRLMPLCQLSPLG